MSAAKDALSDIHPDILCLQEVRDRDSVAELVSILPNFQTLSWFSTRIQQSIPVSRSIVLLSRFLPPNSLRNSMTWKSDA